LYAEITPTGERYSLRWGYGPTKEKAIIDLKNATDGFKNCIGDVRVKYFPAENHIEMQARLGKQKKWAHTVFNNLLRKYADIN
jgi:hypothetical protein